MMRLILKFLLRYGRSPLWVLSPKICTVFSVWVLRKLGSKIRGTPNYLSALIWFDGSDYGLISLGHGVTISSNVRILTHDWSPYTAAKAFLGDGINPKGPKATVTLEDYVFVGTGAIILPGTKIGRGAIIGAGAVVKGVIPEGSVAIGNPAKIVGETKSIVKKFYSLSD